MATPDPADTAAARAAQMPTDRLTARANVLAHKKVAGQATDDEILELSAIAAEYRARTKR